MTTRVIPAAGNPLRQRPDLIQVTTATTTWSMFILDQDMNSYEGRFLVDPSVAASRFLGVLRAWQDAIGLTSARTALQERVPQTAPNELLVQLAAAGSYLFHELRESLAAPIASTFSDLISQHVQGVRPQPLTFLCATSLPWRMMYVHPMNVDRRIDEDDDPADVPVAGFLGASSVVDQMLPNSTHERSPDGMTVPVGIHSAFMAGAGGQSEIQNAIAAHGDLTVQFETSPKVFAKAIAKDQAALIYAFCHGSFGSSTAGMPIQQLILDGRALTGEELRQRIRSRCARLSTAPIAFVNACQGGVFAEVPSATVIEVLLECGARAAIGPLLDMPAVFGAQWGVAIIRRLVNGTSLAAATLDATTTLLRDDGNPLGLAYATTNGINGRLPVPGT